MPFPGPGSSTHMRPQTGMASDLVKTALRSAGTCALSHLQGASVASAVKQGGQLLPRVGLEPSMAPYCPQDKALSACGLPLPHLKLKVLEPASAPMPPRGSTYKVPSAPGHCQPQLRHHLLQEGHPEALDRAPQVSTCSNFRQCPHHQLPWPGSHPGQSCPKGTLATPGDICGCHTRGAPGIERVGPGMLLNIPQFPGRPPQRVTQPLLEARDLVMVCQGQQWVWPSPSALVSPSLPTYTVCPSSHLQPGTMNHTHTWLAAPPAAWLGQSLG